MTKVRLDRDGVPIDPGDWTVEDWRTLHEGIIVIKAIIARRHRIETEPTASALLPADSTTRVPPSAMPSPPPLGTPPRG